MANNGGQGNLYIWTNIQVIGIVCNFVGQNCNIMSLIKSISGIRGTIGGKPGENLTPVDIVKFTSAYGTWIKDCMPKRPKVVVGRDSRRSGPEVASYVALTLQRLGIDVVDLGMATTPTVEIAVTGLDATGGIVISASHNPSHWNALKLLNNKGEFLSAEDGTLLLSIAENEDFNYASFGEEGSYCIDTSWNRKHIDLILELGLVDTKAIAGAGLTVALDCVNSVGGLILPDLLKSLGVVKVVGLNMEPDGFFSHNPEPLPENLGDIMEMVVREKADVAFVVDPDVDRLAIISEDGSYFGEEYTLVAVSDYVLLNTPGNTVSNMSSTMALKMVTKGYGYGYFSAPVGEVNVVEEMKRREAVIGGEGNGGIIYPDLHYGRDALVGIALFLSHLAKSGKSCSQLRYRYPRLVIAKNRVDLEGETDFDAIKNNIRERFPKFVADERDGLKIESDSSWVHVRRSNTEPIIRIYSEAADKREADNLAKEVITIVKNI